VRARQWAKQTGEESDKMMPRSSAFASRIRATALRKNHWPHSGRRYLAAQSKGDGGMYVVKAGLPLILFCGLGVWVVANGIEGKNKERDLFQGRISK